MSRTSIELTEKSAQLVADELIPRKILNEIDRDKKILVVWSYEHISSNEHLLIRFSQTVYENNEYRVYSLSVKQLREYLEQKRTEALDIAMQHAATANYIELTSSSETIWGTPAYDVAVNQTILDSTFTKTDTLLVSFWMKIDPKTELLSLLKVLENDDKRYVRLGGNPNILDGWMLVSDTLHVNAGSRVQYELADKPGVIGRIQIRKANEDFAHQESDRYFMNNIPLN